MLKAGTMKGKKLVNCFLYGEFGAFFMFCRGRLELGFLSFIYKAA